jgi:hypothetical protein
MAEDIKPGASVEAMVTLPDQVSETGMMRVHCFGHVRRCEVKSDDKRGLAVTFERFEFLAAD